MKPETDLESFEARSTSAALSEPHVTPVEIPELASDLAVSSSSNIPADPEHGWIVSGNGVEAYFAERAREVLSLGVTAMRVGQLFALGESLKIPKHSFDHDDAVTIVAELVLELTR